MYAGQHIPINELKNLGNIPMSINKNIPRKLPRSKFPAGILINSENFYNGRNYEKSSVIFYNNSFKLDKCEI